MSSRIDGKISNQSPRTKIGKVLCAKCSKIISHPDYATLSLASEGGAYFIRHYIGTPHFIFDTKSGKAVTYCSAYCKDKHRHC